MTQYEKLTLRIEDLEKASREASDKGIKTIWLRHAEVTRELRDNMPIEDAEREVRP